MTSSPNTRYTQLLLVLMNDVNLFLHYCFANQYFIYGYILYTLLQLFSQFMCSLYFVTFNSMNSFSLFNSVAVTTRDDNKYDCLYIRRNDVSALGILLFTV